MAKRLLVIDGDDRGQFFLSVEEGTLTIGGTAEHGAVVLRDLHISRIRCEVEVGEEAVVVGGLDEADGEDGQPAQRLELRLGETFNAGQANLRLEAAGAESATAPTAGGDDESIGLAE